MDMIVCRNLTKRFGSLVAVEGITLRVGEGELFGFLGPNGAGKTTTIKLMTGLLRASAGTALIGGYDVQSDLPSQALEAKRLFGYIPDNPFLYEKLTGREFLDFMADLYAMAPQGRARRIEDLLHLFELQTKGNDLIQSYSRGMRQKISLAGALIHTPRVLFLDEPTVGLDPRGARTMQEILRELCRRGTTVFISTHILEIAERMCDRVAIVNRGRLIAQGTMEELRAASHEVPSAPEGAPAAEILPRETPEGVPAARSLEEIFLALTGDAERADLAQYLE